MNNRRIFLGGFASIAGLALIGCDKLQQSSEAAKILASQGKGGKRFPTYRYRLTVEVDTPEGVKTGSSVIEVRSGIGGPRDIPAPGSLYSSIRGEAVTVDLGSRGMLFALLRSEVDLEWAHRALLHTVPALTIDEVRQLRPGVSEFEAWTNRALAVPFEQKRPLLRYVKYGDDPVATSGAPNGYPMFVRFEDIAQRETVSQVDADNMAASFGDGVTLKSVTVTLTEADISNGIVSRLPWLKNLNGGLQKIPPMAKASDIQNLPLAFHLSEADFRYMEKQ